MTSARTTFGQLSVRDDGHAPHDNTGMAALALAIIDTAIRDAGSESRTEQEPAIDFLTCEHGDWGSSFNAWCAVAGLDPGWARDKLAPIVTARLRGEKCGRARRTVARNDLHDTND